MLQTCWVELTIKTDLYGNAPQWAHDPARQSFQEGNDIQK